MPRHPAQSPSSSSVAQPPGGPSSRSASSPTVPDLRRGGRGTKWSPTDGPGVSGDSVERARMRLGEPAEAMSGLVMRRSGVRPTRGITVGGRSPLDACIAARVADLLRCARSSVRSTVLLATGAHGADVTGSRRRPVPVERCAVAARLSRRRRWATSSASGSSRASSGAEFVCSCDRRGVGGVLRAPRARPGSALGP